MVSGTSLPPSWSNRETAAHAILGMKQGKAMSHDDIPDDAWSKEQLRLMVNRNWDLFMNGLQPDHWNHSKGVLLSKTGSSCCPPSKTRLINVIPLHMRIKDRVT